MAYRNKHYGPPTRPKTQSSYHDPYDRGDYRSDYHHEPRRGDRGRQPDNIYDDSRDDHYSSRIPEPGYSRGGDRYRQDDADIYSRPHKGADRGYNGVGPGPSPREDYGRGPASEPEMPDLPRHDLDHLATFTVGPKQGLLSPEDGIRKLRQMELSTGVWTMRVQLLVEPTDIVIIDGYTKEEMERFSLSLITEPTAVTNEDRRDVYNNILLFTVREDTHRRAPTEMHIFQVISKPSQDAVDDIKAAKAGKFSNAQRGRNERPPPSRNHLDHYEMQAQHNADIMGRYPSGPQVNQMMSRHNRPSDNDSVRSENTDHNVRRKPSVDGDTTTMMSNENCQQLLNHCFDDIEKFVGRLQQAADAFKELDRRRRGRNQHGRATGDGMLTVRARPPPAKDFVETFQKFKLSFNLLARLKPHIHDPNAPELVHFLFTPLSLVVEASKDPQNGRPDLAAKVIAPLLTHEAHDLLTNCLTSKEADLWRSLGDPWVITREEWKGYVPPFYPRFFDGWQCPESWLADINGGEMPRGSELDSHNSREGPDRGRPQRDYSSQGSYPDYRQDDRNGHKSKEELHRNAMAEYEKELERRGRGRRRESDEPRDPWEADREREQRERDYRDEQREREQRDQELREREKREREERASQQERIELQREIERQREAERQRYEAKKSAASRDPVADNQDRFIRDAQARGAKLWEVIHSRDGRNAKELTVNKGDIVEVIDDSKNWWKVQNSSGASGFTPYTILQKIK